MSDYTLDSHHSAHPYTILPWWLALSQILSSWIVLPRVNFILGDSQEQILPSFNIPIAWLAPGKPKKVLLRE